MNQELISMIKDETALQQYLFVRGFLLSNRNDFKLEGFPFFNQWHCEKLNDGYFAYTHPLQSVHRVQVNGHVFFIFGHAYNPFTMETDEKQILRRIGEAYGTDSYQDRIDEITGVFVIGSIVNGKVAFQVDPSGMQSACYANIEGNFYLSSHAQLIGDICGLSMCALAKELIEYRWYYRVMGPYLPGDMTPFDGVGRIVPNIEYTYVANTVSHKRFYPLRELEEVKTEEEYREVITYAADILKNGMRLVAVKWNKPYISLTGGIDSNTTFAAANGIYDKFKAFSYVSAEKETIDAEAAKKIADRFHVEHILYNIPPTADGLKNYDKIKAIMEHNDGYIARSRDNETRKKIYLMENLDCDVEVKSWVSETIRAYWYKHYGRKSMPKLSPKLFRNLYKIFIFNRPLAHKIDKVFKTYIDEFDYAKIPAQYPPADMHYNEITWGSWGGLNIPKMKIYSDITFIYNNRKFLDALFRVPLDKRISDQHHLDMKKYLNKELYDMHIRVVNMKETPFRAKMLNLIFTINSILPF